VAALQHPPMFHVERGGKEDKKVWLSWAGRARATSWPPRPSCLTWANPCCGRKCGGGEVVVGQGVIAATCPRWAPGNAPRAPWAAVRHDDRPRGSGRQAKKRRKMPTEGLTKIYKNGTW